LLARAYRTVDSEGETGDSGQVHPGVW